jgi:hypothetical protein
VPSPTVRDGHAIWSQAHLPETKVEDDDNPSAARNRLIGDDGLIGDGRRRGPSCKPPPGPLGPDEHEPTATIRSGLDERLAPHR